MDNPGGSAMPGLTGIDVLQVPRVACLRCAGGLRPAFTAAELESLPAGRVRLTAEALAAKEAVVKALGTGFTEEVAWRDIELRRAGSGWRVVLHRQARALAEKLGFAVMVTSGSSRELAVAWACLRPGPQAAQSDGEADD